MSTLTSFNELAMKIQMIFVTLKCLVVFYISSWIGQFWRSRIYKLCEGDTIREITKPNRYIFENGHFLVFEDDDCIRFIGSMDDLNKSSGTEREFFTTFEMDTVENEKAVTIDLTNFINFAQGPNLHFYDSSCTIGQMIHYWAIRCKRSIKIPIESRGMIFSKQYDFSNDTTLGDMDRMVVED